MRAMTPLLVACASLVPYLASAADVRIAMHDGLVSISATDATPRQVLEEWARVGRTTVVNVERMPGGPVSLELRDVPEAQALEVVLRSVSGYIAAPRSTPAGDLSMFDRIVVLPTSSGARPALPPRPAPMAAPALPLPTADRPVDVELENADVSEPAPPIGPPSSPPTLASSGGFPRGGQRSPSGVLPQPTSSGGPDDEDGQNRGPMAVASGGGSVAVQAPSPSAPVADYSKPFAAPVATTLAPGMMTLPQQPKIDPKTYKPGGAQQPIPPTFPSARPGEVGATPSVVPEYLRKGSTPAPNTNR
ncbi:MAG: hypothetical protein JSU08_09450 [Acidobacteria bacterium]|nr:hypothetical protein [Acidobacteriota bacterium]